MANGQVHKHFVDVIDQGIYPTYALVIPPLLDSPLFFTKYISGVL